MGESGERTLISLSEYHAPEAPAHHAFERLHDRVRRLLGGKPDEAVQDDRLSRAGTDALHAAVHDPDVDMLIELLSGSLPGCGQGSAATERVRVVVLPPCEPVDLIARLAERHALATLDPPSRRTMLEKPDEPIEQPPGQGTIVVPRLQRWFLRHPRGLARCRALLQQIAASERRWLVGVDAWTWRYLVRAAGADLLLPVPLVWPPFDADRLAGWLASLIEERDGQALRIHTLKGDADVFARDEEGALAHDYLRELAARSRGIPWVARSLWQRGLRTLPEQDEEHGREHDEGQDAKRVNHDPDGAEEPAPPRQGDGTLWVTHDADRLLPNGHETEAMLVLQALLVHAGLRRVDLGLVLPLTLQLEALLRALHRAGFVECDPDTRLWSVVPCAYPAVHTALSEAGWSMAAI